MPTMPKRSSRLPLLALFCIALALICLAGLFFWLRSEEESAGILFTQNGTFDQQQQQEKGMVEKQSIDINNNNDNMLLMMMMSDRNNNNNSGSSSTIDKAEAHRRDGNNDGEEYGGGDERTTTTIEEGNSDDAMMMKHNNTGSTSTKQQQQEEEETEEGMLLVGSSTSPAPSKLEEITERAYSQHAPECPLPEMHHVGAAECPTAADEGSRQQQQRSATAAAVLNGGGGGNYTSSSPSLLRPFHYAVNISVPSSATPTSSLFLQLSILVELSEQSQVLTLDCGRELGAILAHEVQVWICQTGSLVCVHSVTRLLDKQLLLVELAQPVPARSLLRIQFARLRLPLSAAAHPSPPTPNPSLLVQIPSPWERERAWMLGTQQLHAGVGGGGIRRLFPAIDRQDRRAVFRVCIAHNADLIARANTATEWSGTIPNGGGNNDLVETCFKETPPLLPSEFAFLLFRNLQSISSTNSVSMPNIELFISRHLQPADYGWALEEIEKAMKQMQELTGVAYPLDRLTLVSSPLVAGNDAVGGLGLAQIRDNWMEYPKFVKTHNLLLGQVVRQWSANFLSLCDRCLQEGISMFLEWLIAAELGPVEDKNAEMGRRVSEARQMLLGGDSDGIEASRRRLMAEANANSECLDRAFIIHMLDRAFGRQTLNKFFTLLFRHHSWESECTPTSALSQLFLKANQQQQQQRVHDPATAQRVFDSFLLLASSSSPISVPLIHIRVRPHGSLVQLLLTTTAAAADHHHQHHQQSDDGHITTTTNDDKHNSNVPLPSVPVEFVDDMGKNTQLVINSSEVTLPLVISSFLIAQPNSFARFVYNVENYLRLADCFGQPSKCSSLVNSNALRGALNDLCWALLQQKLVVVNDDDGKKKKGGVNGKMKREKEEEQQQMGGEVALWRQLFHVLAGQNVVHGDCACCMMSERDALRGTCRWTWMDKCSRIKLLTN